MEEAIAGVPAEAPPPAHAGASQANIRVFDEGRCAGAGGGADDAGRAAGGGGGAALAGEGVHEQAQLVSLCIVSWDLDFIRMHKVSPAGLDYYFVFQWRARA